MFYRKLTKEKHNQLFETYRKKYPHRYDSHIQDERLPRVLVYLEKQKIPYVLFQSRYGELTFLFKTSDVNYLVEFIMYKHGKIETVIGFGYQPILPKFYSVKIRRDTILTNDVNFKGLYYICSARSNEYEGWFELESDAVQFRLLG